MAMTLSQEPSLDGRNHIKSNSELAIPYQLCSLRENIRSNSEILAMLSSVYHRWEQDRDAKSSVHISEERRERYLHHTYSEFDKCRLEGGCHLCAIFWSELDAEVTRYSLATLQALEQSGKADRMMAVIKHGGKSMINYGFLCFEIDGTEMSTYI